jgi:hypothetical protein
MTKVSRRAVLRQGGVLAATLLGAGCVQSPVTPPTNPPATGATNWDALYNAALGAIPADARWVSTTGDDAGPGNAARPFLTIARALEGLAGGGQIIIKDGVYSGADNWINPNISAIPNGLSSARRTIIRAENRFKVRLVQSARPNGYTQSVVHLGANSEFIWVDGIIAETTWQAARSDDSANYVVSDQGRNNRLTRIIVKKSSCSRYGGAFSFGVGALLEDCHSIGSNRYAFSGGTGGDSAPSGDAVLRRCTSFMPFGPTMEPTASFSFYGSNDGAYALCRNVLFANCYELDSPHLVDPGGDSSVLKWASFYMPKSVRNISHIGCGSLRNGAEYGAFSTDNFGGNTDLLASYTDCFAWDLRQGSQATAAFRKASNGRIRVQNCTAGLIPGSDLSDASSTDASNNLFTDTPGYVVRRNNNQGAEQRYAVGAFLSGYGEPGFDQPQTTLRLWNFPYETELAAISAEVITKPAQDQPSSVASSSNPYATQTLTQRIWTAAGNPMPALSEIYS